MSLDVYLMGSPTNSKGSNIFIRKDGAMREITREEWDEKFPGAKPVIADADDDCFSANITHNLSIMADAAGIYKHLWSPEEVGVMRAADLIEPLTAGLKRLKAAPEKFTPLNPENGWGKYENLVAFVGQYLRACVASPAAIVRVSR